MSALRPIITLLFTTLAFFSTALAQPKNLLTLKGTDSLAPISSANRLLAGGTRTIEPIRLNARISEHESVTITLDLERAYKGLEGSSIERILLGSANFSSSRNKISSPASAVISQINPYRRELRLLIGTTGSRTLKKRIRMLSLRGKLSSKDSSTMLVRRSKQTSDHICATADTTASRSISFDHSGLASTTLKQLDVIIEGDTEYFNMAGSGAVTEMTQIAAGTDVIYRRDLGLYFNPTIVTNPSAYSATFVYNENFELDFFPEMRSKRPTFNEDVFIVLTGKTPADSSLNNVAGIADDIGSTCKNQSKSLTAVRRFSDSTVGGTVYTLAHEVGHLMGAEHDDQLSGSPSVGYIMNSGTGNPSQFLEEFSQYSKTQIGSYFVANGSCLSDAINPPDISPTPDPNPTPDPGQSIAIGAYLQKSGGKQVPVFYAFQGDTPIPSYQILVYKVVGKRYQLATRVKTNVDGYAFYKKAVKGKYVGVSKLDNSLTTNFVTIRK